jgi:hypothetical protein
MAPDPVMLALGEAVKPGNELAPAALLAVMDADPKPTSTLDDVDRGNSHFEAIRGEFGFLHMCRVTRKAPSGEDQDRLAALMRWLVREFNEWSPANDPKFRKLAALFVVTRYCGQNDAGFWLQFVTHIKINPPLVQELEHRIAGLRSQIAANSLSPTPISDSEIIGRFNSADAAGDWETIASEWPRFGDLVYPECFISQSVRYLHGLAPGSLRHAIDQVRQMVPVMFVLLALTPSEGLALANTSANPYAQFGAILRLLQHQRRNREKITPDEESLLVQLFHRVAANGAQWQAWMRALNRYPVRYPHLQRALGTALAQVSDSALDAYADAINLTTTGVGRNQVAECLRSFRAAAPLPRRQVLWKRAHERWSEWNFDLKETEHLLNIGHCEIDYAVVGYAVECMDAQTRTQKCNDLVARLSVLPISWHASEMDFRRAVTQILSIFQPYAYALQLGSVDDWLIEGRQFFPFDPRSDRYKAMLYKISTP